jgi:hypothetical protein
LASLYLYLFNKKRITKLSAPLYLSRGAFYDVKIEIIRNNTILNYKQIYISSVKSYFNYTKKLKGLTYLSSINLNSFKII